MTGTTVTVDVDLRDPDETEPGQPGEAAPPPESPGVPDLPATGAGVLALLALAALLLATGLLLRRLGRRPTALSASEGDH